MDASKAGGNTPSDSGSTASPPPKPASSSATPTPTTSVRGSKRLCVRDEPGIGAFVVGLALDPDAPPGPRLLESDEIEHLRASKKIVADRANAIFELPTAMPPPQVQAAPT